MQIDLSCRGLQVFTPGELYSQVGTAAGSFEIANVDLSHNSLASIRGCFQGLTFLTVLNLSFNGLTALEGGLPLGLVRLDVSHNSLTSLQGGALLPLTKLETLNVAFNRLVDLRGVSHGGGSASATALRYLDASDNQLSSLNGLDGVLQLQELHVERNLLREAASVSVVRRLPCLRAFLLADNPLGMRKRELHALFTMLSAGLITDIPPLNSNAASSTNTSAVSASTGATAVEVQELGRSANTSRESHGVPRTARPNRTDGLYTTEATSAMTPRDAELPSAAPSRFNVVLPTAAVAQQQQQQQQWGPRATPVRGSAAHSSASEENSPLNGVGRDNTHSSRPRRPLPQADGHALPRLQPYNITAGTAPEGTALSHGESTVAPNALRSALHERVVHGTTAPTRLDEHSVDRRASRAHPSLVERRSSDRAASDREAASEAFRKVVEERDQYRQQVQDLTEELCVLREGLLLERENTAVVLCINEQLQKRMESLAASARQESSGTPAVAAACASAGVAPSPSHESVASLAVAGARSTPPLAPKQSGDIPRIGRSRSAPSRAASTSLPQNEEATQQLPNGSSTAASHPPVALAQAPASASGAPPRRLQDSRRKAVELMAKLRAATD